MSGGKFDYDQYRINHIVDEINDIIECNGIPNEWGDVSSYNDEDIRTFERAIYYLEIARIYAHRIDWYVSGDDGPEAFHRRLAKDLEELNTYVEKENHL